MPSSRNSSPDTSNPNRSYHPRRWACALISVRAVADLLQRRAQQDRTEPAPAVGAVGHHPPDPGVAALVEHPQVGHRRALGLDPQVQGAGLEVEPVQVGVDAVLLDDEDLLTQGEDAVRRDGVQLAEPRPVDVGRGGIGGGDGRRHGAILPPQTASKPMSS